LNILVIRFSSLGDVVLATALLPNLKAKWPEAKLSFLTKRSFTSLLEGNPAVDEIIPLDLDDGGFFDLVKEIRRRRFDLIIDLQGNIRSWFIRLVSGPPTTLTVQKANWARRQLVLIKKMSPLLKESVKDRILHCADLLEVPQLNTETQLYAKNAESLGAKFSIPKGKLLGVAAGAKHKTKRWPAAKFAETANRLAARMGAAVILLGDKSDMSVAQEVSKGLLVPFVNLAGQTDLSEMIGISSQLSLLLTNDSGLMHVGEAIKIPLVAVFGPTVQAFGFAPYRSTSKVVEKLDLNCRPCSLHGDESCPLGHHKCMVDITSSEVEEKAVALL
jgi:heptosyltransferase II